MISCFTNQIVYFDNIFKYVLSVELRSIHICYLLGVNYPLNNEKYCTKRVHSHFLFDKLLHVLESSIMSLYPLFCDCVY